MKLLIYNSNLTVYCAYIGRFVVALRTATRLQCQDFGTRTMSLPYQGKYNPIRLGAFGSAHEVLKLGVLIHNNN